MSAKKDATIYAAALICEKVVETEGGRVNILGIMDIATIGPVPPNILITLFVVLKCETAIGRSEVTVTRRTPSGQAETFPQRFEIILNGGEQGTHLTLDLTFPIEYGIHWFDVHWQGELLTSTPLKVQNSGAGDREPPSRGRRLDPKRRIAQA